MNLFKKKSKVFCIGQNKTGTTSVEAVLKELGYKMGNQIEAELLLDDWAQRDFKNIVKYCQSADAFQDVPFSLDYTYQVLDYAFPGSKFILTVRNSKEDWYSSMTNFQRKIVGKGRLPTGEDLKNFSYRKKGWLWDAMQYIYDINESNPYDFELLTTQYDKHNTNVEQY